MSSQPNSSADPSRTPQDDAAREMPIRGETDGTTPENASPETSHEENPAGTPDAEAGGDERQPEALREESPPSDVPPEAAEAAEDEPAVEDEDVEEEVEDVEPLEEATAEDLAAEEDLSRSWYILKVQVNREESIKDALVRRIKIAALDRFFGDIIVPTEDVAEFNKSGKRRIVKRKLYPGYIMVHMALNDDTWFLVRETPGIGDFTGSAGKPTPMDPNEVQRIISSGRDIEGGEGQVKTAIPFRTGDRVRVKEGYFQNFEGDVDAIDEANGRVTVMINIFGRSTPVELEHWQIEAV